MRKPERKSLLVAAVLFTVFLGGAAFLETSATTKSPGKVAPFELATLLPEDTLALVDFDGEAIRRHGGKLALTSLFEEPDLVAALKPLFGDESGFLGLVSTELSGGLGLKPADAIELLQGRLSIAVLGVDACAGEPADVARLPVPDLVIAFDFAASMDAARRGLQTLESLMSDGEFSDVSIAGFPARRFQRKVAPAFGFSYLVQDSVFLLGTREASFARVLSRLKVRGGGASLATADRFLRIRGKVDHEGSFLEVYFDTPAVLRTVLERFFPEVADEVTAVAAATGIDCVEQIGYACGFEGRAIRDRLYAHMPRGGPLRNALATGNGTLSCLGVLSAETPFVAAARLDPNLVVGWIHGAVTAAGAGDLLDGAIANVDGMLGLDIRKDLLPLLGPEIALAVSTTAHGVLPEAALMIEVRDAGKAGELLVKVGEALGKHVQARSVSVLGHEIHVLDLTGGRKRERSDFNANPGACITWTIVKNFLVVSPWPEAAKNLIAGVDARKPRLAARKDVAEGLAAVRTEGRTTETGVVFFDLARLAGFVLDNGVPIAQLIKIPKVPIDFDLLPPSDVLTRHLFPLTGTAGWTGEGFDAQALSPCGVLGPYALAAAIASAVLFVPVAVEPESDQGPTGELIPKVPVIDAPKNPGKGR